MKSPLRLLHLEDDAVDADIVQKTLEHAGAICSVTRVDNEADFRASLEQGSVDLILADYSLPEFDGISALNLAREIVPDVPFIFLSGTLGEEVAIEALKFGATDYVFKTRLSRIVPSVQRALREAQERVERRRAEEALRRSEAYFRLIVDSIPGLVCTMTAAGAVERVNQRILDYTGKTLDELQDWQPLIHPDDLARATTQWKRSVETGHPYDIEHRILRTDGVYRWFHVLGQPLLDAEGEIVRWYHLLTDIDERKRAEEELRRSQAFLAEAQSISLTGSFGWSVSSGNIYWSEETYKIFEQDRAAKPTLALVLERIHPDDRDRVQQTLDRASEARADFDFEHRLLMPDGSIKHLRVVGHAEKGTSRQLEFVGAVMDGTAAKEAEESLRRSNAYLHEAQRLGHVGSFAHNLSSGAFIASPELLRIFGFDPDKEKPTVDMMRARIHPADVLRLREAADSARREKTDYDLDFRLVRPDGSIRHGHTSAHAVFDDSGDVVEFIGTTMDVTERSRAEDTVRQAQAELAHMARVSTLGAMAASIAHEVDQPLSGVVTNAGASLRFLSHSPPNLEEVRDGLEAMGRDARRASDVIARIRALARRTVAEKAPLDINEVIREVVVLAEGEARRTGATLRTDLAGDLPRVLGDRVQLQQVVLNLVLNGLDAMSGVVARRRELVITTQPETSDRVRVAVQDSGSGIDPQVVSRMFEAFYTTKVSGLGMGPSISRSIIEQHGGRLWAVPNEGPGTTFHFTV